MSRAFQRFLSKAKMHVSRIKVQFSAKWDTYLCFLYGNNNYELPPLKGGQKYYDSPICEVWLLCDFGIIVRWGLCLCIHSIVYACLGAVLPSQAIETIRAKFSKHCGISKLCIVHTGCVQSHFLMQIILCISSYCFYHSNMEICFLNRKVPIVCT